MTTRLPQLLDHLADAVFLHDRHGRFFDVNQEACRSLQYTRDELMKMTIFELDVTVEQRIVSEQLAAMQEGDTLTAVSHHRRKDGVAFPIEVRLTCAACHADTGERLYLAIVHDISKRVADQQEIERLQSHLARLVAERTAQLQESTRLLRGVLDHTRDAIFVKDRDGRYLLCNRAVCGFLGRPEAEILGRVDTELFSPESGREIMDRDAMIMHEGGNVQIEEIATSDGTERVYLANKTAYRDENGAVIGLIGISRDITTMRRAEEAARQNDARLTQELRETSNRLQMAVAAANLGVWELDIRTDKMQLDDRMREMFGFDSNLLESSASWRESIHPADLAQVQASWQRALAEPGRKLDEEFRIHHRVTGEERIVRVLAQFVRDETGQPIRVVGIDADVTEPRRITEVLLQTKETAVRAERAKSSFLAAASHELRTPLNGVVGIAELLLDSGLTPRQRSAVELMKRSGDNLLVIVDDLLDSARIDAGTLRLRSVPFQLTRVLADAFALLGADADAKGLRLLGEHWPAETEDMRGDPDRLLQIIGNLIRNAIKFTPVGTVTVAVQELPGDGPRPSVRIEVHDTGTGIPAELRSHIFEPFVQAHGGTSGSLGTGLGLWICRHLVQRMGGRIGVESDEGRGSTFWIELPRHMAMQHATLPTPPGGLPATKLAEYRPLRLLLVEDNEPNRHVATLMLEHFGHSVCHAENGRRALTLLDGTSFDAILMDCEMPELDGYETTREIRAREQAASASEPLPILALTASGMPETRARCLAAGMTAYALKPLRRDELAAAFHSAGLSLINPRGSRDKPPSVPPPVLDGGQVEQLREIFRPDGSTLFDLVAGLVLREMPDRMDSLDRLLTRQEPQELAHLAHKIAGSSASIGAALLYEHAQALEQAARSEAWAEAGALVARSHAAWSEVRGELQKLLQ